MNIYIHKKEKYCQPLFEVVNICLECGFALTGDTEAAGAAGNEDWGVEGSEGTWNA